MKRYLRKMCGSGQAPACVCYADIAWAWIGALLGILPVAALHGALLDGDGVVLIGPAGAEPVALVVSLTARVASLAGRRGTGRSGRRVKAKVFRRP